ncbi:MAG: rod shape-determining protein MreC [Oscillospiraceae bacterium]|nr:rod shape-determining protein MreC [Oscillospiraceae bacterium]
MKRLLKRKAAFTAAAVGVALVIMGIISAFTSGRASILTSAAGFVTKPFRLLASSVSGGASSFLGYIRDYDALQAENTALAAEIERLRRENRELEGMRRENEELRVIAGLKETRPSFVFVSAAVTARSTSNWARTLTLDKGSSAGIAAGHSVLSAEGGGCLVGVVAEVSPGWCVVRLVTDSSFAAGAVVYRTAQTAVAEGRFDLMTRGRLGLLRLPSGSDLRIGDLVLTSGAGGVLPPGLPIAAVASVYDEKDGFSLTAELVPAVSPDRLSAVYVVIAYEQVGEP